MKTIGIMLLFLGVAGVALANDPPPPVIDAGVGPSALALLTGATLIIRSCMKK